MREPLESGWLTQGPKVAEFERAFADRHGCAHALATTSCTTALHLALAAAGVGPGDEVIVPAFTWIASANAVAYCGARPVFADVLADTYNLDPAALAAAVSPRTKAVIAVHLFGLCADMDAIRAELPHDTFVLEDAACAAGAAYRGRSAGTLGDAGAFSFHPRKTITTGEGGMVTTGDARLAERAEVLRNHGASLSEEARHQSARPHQLPDFEQVGFNYRMTDLQAAVGIVQLAKLDGFVSERDRWARWYSDEIATIDWLEAPAVSDDCVHGWQSYVTTVADDAPFDRNVIMDRLQERGVATRPGTHCVPNLSAWRVEPSQQGEPAFPVADMLEQRTLALPLHNRMRTDDYAFVVEALREL